MPQYTVQGAKNLIEQIERLRYELDDVIDTLVREAVKGTTPITTHNLALKKRELNALAALSNVPADLNMVTHKCDHALNTLVALGLLERVNEALTVVTVNGH